MSKYIDADKLKQHYAWWDDEAKKIFDEIIDLQPAADVAEVRHGRWIKDKNLYKCTACDELLTVAGWADCIPEKQIYKAFKYCPNCGSRMDLGGDAE